MPSVIAACSIGVAAAVVTPAHGRAVRSRAARTRRSTGRVSSHLVVSALGDIPPPSKPNRSAGGGPSKLIIPGSADFPGDALDSGNRPGGGLSIPGGAGNTDLPTYLAPGQERPADEPFAQYRPPSEFEESRTDETDTQRMLAMLQQQAAPWFELAKFIPVRERRVQVEHMSSTPTPRVESALGFNWLKVQCFQAVGFQTTDLHHPTTRCCRSRA